MVCNVGLRREELFAMSSAIEEHQLLEGLSIVHLKFLRVWQGINTYLTTGRKSTAINVLTVHCVLFALPYVLFQFLSFFFIRVDVKKLSFLFLNSLPCSQVMIKAVVFWLRLDEECDIFNLLKQDFLTCIPKHKMPYAKEFYKKTAKRTNIACLMAFYGTSSCVVSWILAPGINGEDMTGATSKKVMGGWYPFPFSQSPWYYIVFVYETALLISHGLLISFFECVMIQPLLCLYAHFKVLGYHISTLKVTDVVHSGTEDSSEYLNSQLRDILSDYDVLLRYSHFLYNVLYYKDIWFMSNCCRYATTLQDVLNILVTVILGTGIIVLIIGILEMMFVCYCMLMR